MEFRFHCPKCNQKLKAELESAGMLCHCPSCGTDFRIPQPPSPSDPSPSGSGPSARRESSPRPISPTGGQHTCPACWEKFDTGDMMHIAAHDSLRGDPVLGPDVQQRFKATRFNRAGQALDAMGLPVFDLACPHCRRKLPPGFVEIPHHIISLVGDQSAGKSYFLAVMAKVFPGLIFQRFDVIFADTDPTANAPLNQMRNALFGGDGSSSVKLAKTVLEGAMYQQFPRHGRMVALPRPFIYTLTPRNKGEKQCNLVFYDNAGEHFQPGVNIVEQPGAQHVASASGIMFLFDPMNSPEFRYAIDPNHESGKRGRISFSKDDFNSIPMNQDINDIVAQFEKPIVDQQDIILAEMRARIQGIKNLRMDETPNAPVAFIVGKCDTWVHLLKDTPLRDEPFNKSATESNSRIVRNLLLRLCPSVVANAERLSSNIKYFATSSFGHTPEKIGPGEFAPVRNRLRPVRVEMPLMWILSQITPSILSNVEAGASREFASTASK